jgi:uroporphyrinogen decarboxylase
MNSRERIRTILNRQEPDRVGFQDTDFFSDTLERWHGEGLPRSVDVLRPNWPWLNVPGLRYFGHDIYVTWPDISLKYDAIDYEVADNWSIAKDEFGTTKKSWTGKTASPQFLDPVVKTPQDFEGRVEPLLDHLDIRRVSSAGYPFRQELEQMVKRFQREFFVTVGVVGPWEYSTYLCGGLAATLVFVMKNQDFASSMFMRIADFLAKICESYIAAGADGLWVFDDQGSQDGPFFSPRLYERLLEPAHEKVCAPFVRRDLPRLLHSDGHIEPLIPHFIDAGFLALHPVQNKAGMDVKKLKERYGDELALIGGMDTRILSSGDLDAIRNEVRSKIGVAAKGGGYIAASDGPVPPTISLDSYKFFVEAVKKYGAYPIRD